MSSSVGRNSLIMASGTIASRVTGQLRTICLVAALGTTGIAANAYQAGAQIPQVIFNLISTGIFNAVLVPQIVRTLKQKDADERLSRLITLAIALLLAVTVLMMAGTPLLTSIYLDSSWTPAQRALANAFTLWCMPQILFYGLYTVIGQVLAAKGRFATYAWSSVGANVISCLGFGAFVLMFGNAANQPMDFWTPDKVAFTAGAWTAGVAFQALVLFIPLFRSGIRYRVRWGLRGFGLRSMGKVAMWSIAMVCVSQLANIIVTRVNTGAPAAGGDLDGIAGNAAYQYAYSIYILPYSIVAASIATAVFPRISAAVGERRVDDARMALSSSLRSNSLAMLFFTAAIAAMPVPLVKALIPSTTLEGAQLIGPILLSLLMGLLPTSAYLLVQRAFYAWEDGRSPFVFTFTETAIQLAMLFVAIRFLPPRWWAVAVGLSLSLSYVVAFPFMFWLLRRRFGGRLDGRRLLSMHVRALVAAVGAFVAGFLVREPATRLVGARTSGPDAHLGWFQSIAICAVVGIVVAAVYAALLWALRVREFTDLASGLAAKLRGRIRRAAPAVATVAAAPAAPAAAAAEAAKTAETAVPATMDATVSSTTEVGMTAHDRTDDEATDDGMTAAETAAEEGPASEELSDLVSDVTSALDRGDAAKAGAQPPSFAPTFPVEKTSVLSPLPDSERVAPEVPSIRRNAVDLAATAVMPEVRMAGAPSGTASSPHHGAKGTMRPQLGDTVFNRYALVAQLRVAPGIEAWKANDRVLARDCQIYFLTASSVIEDIDRIAAALVVDDASAFTPVYQFRRMDDCAVLITAVDAGLSLTEYLTGRAGDLLSFDAMRSIVGDVAQAVQRTEEGVLTTDTIRLSTEGVEVADAPLTPLLAAPVDAARFHGEQRAVRQLAAVLYCLLMRTPSGMVGEPDLDLLPDGTPAEFRVIIRRGLELGGDTHVEPMVTLAECTALLGEWTPTRQLPSHDVALPSVPGNATIAMAPLRSIDEDDVAQLPDGIVTTEKTPDYTIRDHAAPVAEDGPDAPAMALPHDDVRVRPTLPSLSSGRLTSLWHHAEERRPASSPSDETTVLPASGPTTSDLFREFGTSSGMPAVPSAPTGDSLPSPAGIEPLGPGEATTRIPVLGDDRPLSELVNATERAERAARDRAAAGAAPQGVRNGSEGAEGVRREGTPATALPAAAGAWGASDGAQPPSFAPAAQTDGSSQDEEDLSDQKLFGRLTTKAVAIIVGSLVLVLALVIAVLSLTHDGGRPRIEDGNNWPDQNLNSVPFGQQSDNGGKSDKGKDGSDTQASAPDVVDIIDVTSILD